MPENTTQSKQFRFKNQQFQTDAVNAACNVFEGQPKQDSLDFVALDPGIETDDGMLKLERELRAYRNTPVFDFVPVLQNIRREQNKNTLPLSDAVERTDIMPNTYQLSVSMETGVGKTFTYIKTIYELNQRYGWTKFVIVVPSIAIREGVLKTFKITERTFSVDYGKTANVFVYASDDLQKVEEFATSSDIQVMIINTQAFNSNSIMMNEQPEKLNGRIPVNIIATTRPVMILDEPQEIDGNDQGQIRTQLARFNPMMMLRYSATHKDYYNLIYSLDSVDAFNMKLVKKISVIGVEGDFSHFQLQSVESGKNGPVARVRMFKQGRNGITNSTVTLEDGDNLYEKSGELERYKNYNNARIDARDGSISFDNGTKLFLNEEQSSEAVLEIRKLQIQKTIQAHLDKEEELFSKGIKVLSLFFIDHVVNYRDYDAMDQKGKYAKIFEEEYAELVKTKIENLGQLDTTKQDYIAFLKKTLENVPAVHSGYFAQDKNGHFSDKCKSETGESKKDAAEKAAFDLIMRDKEKLLSQEEPVRFIFSHSALKEGWDNPNVFQICALKPMGDSEIKRKQEVGRGLRICVNQNLERMDSEEVGKERFFNINTLTVIANESYSSFARGIQSEFAASCMQKARRIDVAFLCKKGIGTNPDGSVHFLDEDTAKKLHNSLIRNGYLDDDDRLTDKYLKDVGSDAGLTLPEMFKPFEAGIVKLLGNGMKNIPIADDEKPNSVKLNKQVLNSDVFLELWDKIKGKSTFTVKDFDEDAFIKKAVNQVNGVSVAPIEITITNGELIDKIKKEDFENGTAFKVNVNGVEHVTVKFTPTTQPYDLLGSVGKKTRLPRRIVAEILGQIKDEVFAQYKVRPDEFIFKVSKKINECFDSSLRDCIEYHSTDESYDLKEVFKEQSKVSSDADIVPASPTKSIFSCTVCDSTVEHNFAEQLEADANVLVYAKLPTSSYKISYPGGNYTPDWAIVFKHEPDRVYFVVETKGTDDENLLRLSENTKKICAEKHFKAICGVGKIPVQYKLTDKYDKVRSEAAKDQG